MAKLDFDGLSYFWSKGKTYISNLLKGKADSSHTHDDRYYTESEIDIKLNGKANNSHTHGNEDITSLDAGKITSGTISIDRLPQGALERLTVVTDDMARFKLTSATVQKGDTVKVTSTEKMYYVVDETKLSTEEGYEIYAAGTAASVPWSGIIDKPETYTPSNHNHIVSEISDFPSSLPANGGNASTVNGHTVDSDVPADAKFTDTIYTHPTTSGNKHIPPGGSSGQVLGWQSDGIAKWVANENSGGYINLGQFNNNNRDRKSVV